MQLVNSCISFVNFGIEFVVTISSESVLTEKMAPTPDSTVTVTPHSDATEIDDGFVNVAFENDMNPHNALSDVMLTSLDDANLSEKNKVRTPAPTPPSSEMANVDFDDMLPHIGEFGRYQKILFFLMIPFTFFVAFVYFAQIFMTLVPEKHWCRIPELDHLPLNER